MNPPPPEFSPLPLPAPLPFLRPRHGAHCPTGNGLAEGVSPPYHRDPEGACSLQLRVVSRYRSGDHDRSSPSHVPWVVTPPYFHPVGCQIGGEIGRAHV